MFIIGQQPLAGPPADSGEKWLKYYCSNHQILLVGEGDFSFSLSLALCFCSASNILATSLDSYHDVVTKYRNARINLTILKGLGASILHGVDATKMKRHVDLHMRKFDRIIFNFPHAGFFLKEDNFSMIQMHKALVYEFFKNASQMLRIDGEIHVNHKTKAPFRDWNVVQLAHQNSLELVGLAAFNIQEYPGYNNKRGQGSRCDDPFFLGECSTYKFSINHRAKRTPSVLHMSAIDIQRNLPFQEMPISDHCHCHRYRTSFESSYCHGCHISMQNHPTPFETDCSRVTHSINAHSYQASLPVPSLNHTYRNRTTSPDTAQAYASKHPTVDGSLLNSIRVLRSRFERMSNFDDHVYWSSILRSSYGEETERSDAHTTPASFHHW